MFENMKRGLLPKYQKIFILKGLTDKASGGLLFWIKRDVLDYYVL